ncbi:unnamed protein product [[Candida] boidinii]|nr:unnamed protein product [[Candida] boidinii]
MSNLPERSLRSKNSANTNANANTSTSTNNGSRMYTSPLDPSNNSKLSKSSANDLKSQLFDLQKKINSNRLSSPGKEPEIHLPPSIPTAKSSSSPTTASSPSSTSFSSIRQQRQQLHQQQQQQQQQSHSQVSSLAFDKSSREPTQVNDPSALIRKKPSHNQLSSKNLNVQSSPNPNPKPNSNVSFLSDLSDGLLLESRRLNSENSILKLNLKELKNSFDDTKKKLNNLTIINKQLSTQEEELKNKNWELETELSNSNDLLNQKLKELI